MKEPVSWILTVVPSAGLWVSNHVTGPILLILIVVTVSISLNALRGRSLFKALFVEMPLDWVSINLTITVAIIMIRLALRIDLEPFKIDIARWLTEYKQVEFIEVLEDATQQRLEKYDVWRLDADSDGFDEWVVFYNYELGTGRNPIGGAVYDVDDCRPPTIMAYELVPLDRDYLAEESARPVLEDIDGDKRKELLVWGSSGGSITELAIFRWFDHAEKCKPAGRGERGYALLGSFRGTGGIQRDGSRVIVNDRGPFERSQLVLRRTYEMQVGTYLRLDGKSLVEPIETAVDFGYGQPTRVPETYYPEKTIVALYQALPQMPQEPSVVQSLVLTDTLHDKLVVDTNFGTGVPAEQLKGVLIKALHYPPDAKTEQAFGPVDVQVCLQPIRKDGRAEPVRVVQWRIEGIPREGALPYGCEWRLVKLEPLSFAECPWLEGF